MLLDASLGAGRRPWPSCSVGIPGPDAETPPAVLRPWPISLYAIVLVFWCWLPFR